MYVCTLSLGTRLLLMFELLDIDDYEPNSEVTTCAICIIKRIKWIKWHQFNKYFLHLVHTSYLLRLGDHKRTRDDMCGTCFVEKCGYFLLLGLLRLCVYPTTWTFAHMSNPCKLLFLIWMPRFYQCTTLIRISLI